MKLRFEYRLTLLYLFLGGLWILFSDRLLLFFTGETHSLSHWQTYKGWFFVGITGLFLYSFVRRQMQKIEKAEKALQETNQRIQKQNLTLIQQNKEIEQINGELEVSRNRALEGDRLKTAFLENMSHEIRTPLNSIVGFSELITDPVIALDEKQVFAQIIKSNSNQLLKIVHDILDISSLRTAQIALHYKSFYLPDFLALVYSEWEPEARAKGLLFEKPVVNADSATLVKTDEKALHKILNNLVHNAIKFTPRGKVSITAYISGQMLNVKVFDTGIGIDIDHQVDIFEPFFQLTDTQTKFIEGTGLGLAIVKEYTALLGGTIHCTSSPGSGSVFILQLPIQPVQARVVEPTPDNPASQQEWNGKKILIVEDEQNNYRYLYEILKPYHLQICHAENGTEAVDFIKNNPDTDLVLMDIKIPVLNGYEATRRIKELRPEVPVIAQTAYALAGDEEKARDAGCTAYLSKPIRRLDILDILKAYLH
ncbi:MAG: ATP-binding protein [Bacteroidales bacterium]|nr:ATP-binding protein [Bacteroidales bacterium]MDD3010252.1 ATP-binding protein [Bacteroidales bacterium]MDD3961984.1 ATP-binding protein [Bacteroidales bacterium]MDY0284905.1 ATP-binding protein [Bacteroidales bacterium]HPE85929.1 ATP-binding protein [Bacteroidales bacterium]